MADNEEAGKLFIGGLSWETTQENLETYFSRFGEVVDCVVMKNNETGRSRGFGFVTFKDPNCVSIVLASGPHELDGRTIDPKACNPRGMNKGNMKKGGNFPKVFLRGLPSNCTETMLREFFSKYGKVMEVVIMYDQERKKSRGFGFLSFEKEEYVHRVCADHYVTINGKQIECKMAEPREMSKSAKASQQGNQDISPWGGPGMGMGASHGGWGPGPMGGAGGTAGGPGMGPGGPSGTMGPNMGGMGNMGPMANGMMPGGWGGPQQTGPYGAQGGWGPAPGGYAGYQGWGASPTGFGPYGGPGTQYGQQGYGGFGTGAPGFGGYGGFGATMGAAPGPGGPVAGQTPSQMYGQAGPNAAAATPGSVVPPGTQNAAGGTGAQGPPSAGVKQEYNSPYGAMGNYAQEASSFGPARGYGAGGMDGMQGYGMGSQGFGSGMAGNFSGQGDSSAAVSGGGGAQGTRTAGAAQGYHPYRR
ncbi:uncharacterized protein LOC143239828 isoform X1 [Tachypleus tridentatus]|uniref:uncharacterized protein LOC143239828 isoform X1 n=1 Tax=Tachypleus tridentatus TaxID=6853 RepID=UPI003FD3AF55